MTPPRPRHPLAAPVLLLLGMTALWAYVGVVLLGALDNVAVLPIWIVLGATTVPAALLLLISRARLGPTNGRRVPIRPGILVLAATAGGVLAVVVGGTVDALVQPSRAGGLLADRALLLAGPVEEAAKLAVVIALAAALRLRTATAGLLLGAAVGLGFAAFEDMGYAMAPFLDRPFDPALLLESGGVQVARQLTTAVGHPLWSALLGAAALGATGSRRRRWAVALLAFAGVALAHSAWDGAAVLGGQVLGEPGAIAARVLVGLSAAAELLVLRSLLRSGNWSLPSRNRAERPVAAGAATATLEP